MLSVKATLPKLFQPHSWKGVFCERKEFALSRPLSEGVSYTQKQTESLKSSLLYKYEGVSISNQPNLFPVEIHLFFFVVIAL